MARVTRANLTINYVDGRRNRFAFLRQEDDPDAIARIQEAVASKVLILELEDRVMYIPFHSIKSVEVYPKPERLPRHAVRGVRLLS